MKAPTSSDKRLRLFENRWLEKLTVISVGWFVAVWSVALCGLAFLAWGSAPAIAVVPLVIAGWLIFSLVEYTAHRYLFHWAAHGDTMKKVVFVMHGNHHIQPTDKLRSLMPPIVSFPIVAAFAVLLNAVFGQTGDWILVGFVLGYVAYDIVHYGSHHWPMRGRLGQQLKRHHMLHHFALEEGNYAVTALLWDRVFGTSVKIGKRSRASRNAAQAGQNAATEPAK